MKRYIPVIAITFTSFVVCAFCIMYFQKRHYATIMRYRYECPMRLTGLWIDLESLRASSGRYPTNLEFFAQGFKYTPAKGRLHLHPLLCPGSNARVDSTNVVEWSDYAYIDWSKWFSGTNKPPAWYPILYDRRMANHGNRAIYVVKVDGSVIFDGGARWLHEFAEKHPAYGITVPE